jgi:dolichyl-phosphate-mannose-protein mannosyltransferase
VEHSTPISPTSLVLARPSVRVVALVFVLLGIGLRLAQYFHNESLWLDEAFLALNLQNRSLGQLFGVLDYNQASPPGYLFLEKVLASAFGGTEYALRAVALVAGIASVPLFYLAARRILRPWPAVLALALFAVLDPFVQHGAEVKQYSSDVLVAVGLLLVVLGLAPPDRLSGRRLVSASLVGAASVWLSYPAVFLLAGFGTVLLGEGLWRRDRRRIIEVGAVCGAWLASWAVLYSTLLHSTEHLESSFRADIGGTGGVGATGGGGSGRSEFFLPFPPKSTGDLGWFPSAARSFVTASMGFPRWQTIGIALLALLGLVVLLRSRPREGCLLIAPLVFILAGSALEKYPFGLRFTLFYGPYVLLLIAAAVGWIAMRLAGDDPRPVRTLAAAGAGLALLAFLAVPLQSTYDRAVHHSGREEIKPALAVLQDRWRAGDTLYVFNPSQYALRYYDACTSCGAVDRDGPAHSLWRSLRLARPSADDFAPALSSNPPGFLVGLKVGRETDAQVRAQLDRMTGRPRVWALFTHIVDPNGSADFRAVVDRLDELGRRRLDIRPPGAALLLYDLRR